MLGVLALAELLGMSLWFAGTAVAPLLAARWALGATAAAWLAITVQLGFVAGTALAAALNLADILPARWYFAAAALAGAMINALLVWAPSYEIALVIGFLTGACLAGVYPPAMKMISTWFDVGRGLAIGTIIGALTAGKALPYLLRSLPEQGIEVVVLGASGAAIAAALLVAVGYRDGPVPFPRRAFDWSLAAQVMRGREYRLALGSYLGHMWELYSYWVWIPAFIASSMAGAGPTRISLLSFFAIAVGAVGCVWGGAIADRIGTAKLVIRALAISGTCALLTPLVYGRSPILLTILIAVWGMSVIADSAQFSTLVTRVVPAHAVGTALTLQVSLGFLLTTISIRIVPPLVEALGWRWAFPILALGPAFGILAMRPLLTKTASPAGSRLVQKVPG